MAAHIPHAELPPVPHDPSTLRTTVLLPPLVPQEGLSISPAAKSRRAFELLDHFSLKMEGGLGARYFNDGRGFGPSGKYVRNEFGYRIREISPITFTPHAFFDYQDFKDLSSGKLRSAEVYAVGAGGNVGFTVLPYWLSIHALLGVGAAFYPSSGNGTGEDSTPAPANETRLRVNTGLRVCMGLDAICVGMMFTVDTLHAGRTARSSSDRSSLESRSLMGGVSLDLVRATGGLVWAITLLRDLGGIGPSPTSE